MVNDPVLKIRNCRSIGKKGKGYIGQGLCLNKTACKDELDKEPSEYMKEKRILALSNGKLALYHQENFTDEPVRSIMKVSQPCTPNIVFLEAGGDFV